MHFPFQHFVKVSILWQISQKIEFHLMTDWALAMLQDFQSRQITVLSVVHNILSCNQQLKSGCGLHTMCLTIDTYHKITHMICETGVMQVSVQVVSVLICGKKKKVEEEESGWEGGEGCMSIKDYFF